MRYVLIALLLCGCATQEQRLAKAEETCEKIGYAPGTDKFLDCKAEEYRADRARRAAASRAAVKPTTTCQSYGNTTSCN